MLGNSRMILPDAMHAGQERSVRRGRGLAASAAPVGSTLVRFPPTGNHKTVDISDELFSNNGRSSHSHSNGLDSITSRTDPAATPTNVR